MKNEHKITIKLESSEWSKILDDVFKKKNKETTIEGFRKGRAPKEIFLKHFGVESLYMDAVDMALPIAYERAIKENNLLPVCEPKVDVTNINTEEVTFEFVIITKPEVKVSNYKNLKCKKGSVKVTKKEIQEEIEHARKHFAEIIIKDNGQVEDGDIAVIDYEGFVNGKPFDGGSGKDYPLEIGSNTFIDGFEEGLIGAKKDSTLDVNVTFPEDYVEDLKGKDAVFKVTVKEIKTRILPELGKEFYEDLGFTEVNTKEELEKKIEEYLLEQKEEEAEDKYLNDLFDAGIANMTVEINDEIIEQEINRMVSEIANRLEREGIPLDSYLEFTGSNMEKIRETAKPEAIRRIKVRYLLDTIIEEEKLTASMEEAKEHAKTLSDQYDMDEEEFIESYGGLDTVKYDLLVHKAINVLKGE